MVGVGGVLVFYFILSLLIVTPIVWVDGRFSD
jgi:hypothetical protein